MITVVGIASAVFVYLFIGVMSVKLMYCFVWKDERSTDPSMIALDGLVVVIWPVLAIVGLGGGLMYGLGRLVGLGRRCS